MPDDADLSRVLALAHKGNELRLKAHDARSAEKFRLAAEEAEIALLFPDSLVTCALHQDQLHALVRHATTSMTPADKNEALREAFTRLLPSVMGVLNRRKAAGTLLPGSCRPEEEIYQMALKLNELQLEGHTRASVAKWAPLLAPRVGVETYLRNAAIVAYMLKSTDTLTLKRAYVLSDEQIDAAYLFVVSALDLMTQERKFDGLLAGEPGLVREVRALIPAVSDMDNPVTKKLCAAWQRVLRSGVLRTRGIDEAIDATDQRHKRITAAAAADIAAGRLQQCALSGCAARESHVSHFKRCGACRDVWYCCKEHQVEDWPSHKAACKVARKAAADPAGASDTGA